MSTYTCNSCRVIFSSKSAAAAAADTGSGAVLACDLEAATLQKEHYKSDWHRYNLKRKVTDLPPVTLEDYEARIAAYNAQFSTKAPDASSLYDVCGNHFKTLNAFENHCRSKKHKDAITKLKEEQQADGKRASGETTNQAQSAAAAQVQRLNAENAARSSEKKDAGSGEKGCDRASKGGLSQAKMDRNLEALFSDQVDDDDDWDDVDDDDDDAKMSEGEEEETEEDMELDGDRLTLDQCLFCAHRSLGGLEGSVKHMTVAHGFFIPDVEYLVDLEGLMKCLGRKVSYLRMCLWCSKRSRVFPELRAVQQHMTDKGHCKVLHEGDAVLEYADFYDYRSSYPDYNDRLGFPKDDDDDDDIGSAAGLVDKGDNPFQLVLPSGATLGHRALLRYYRQKLRLGRELVVSSGNSSSICKIMAHYKAIGYLGTTGAAAIKKAKDIAFVNRIKQRHSMHVGIKANKLQKHYRDDVFGCK